MAADEEHAARCQALLTAVAKGDLAVMEQLMSANPGLGMIGDAKGRTALMCAAAEGNAPSMRLLLDHPSADPAVMMRLGDDLGGTALMYAAVNGNVDAMRLLLDHPSADSAAMMAHAAVPAGGLTTLMAAAMYGHVDALRLLLDHPSADASAMMELSFGVEGTTALVCAARFAAQALDESDPVLRSRCAPLLFLLRRIAVQPQPSDAQQAHMTKVMEALCQGPRSNELFDVDQPEDARDECVHLLMEYGAQMVPARCSSPVFKRIIRECFAQARVPQRINEAVLGMAIARQP
jgi:ankyrin repeat protein